jgi:hypothetical protein
MLDWLGREGDELRKAFADVFRAQPRPFGKRSTHIGGVSDGNAGVQWNAGYDPRDGRRWLGVNLEGMQYDGWPIARLINRELRRPTLPELIEQLGDTDPITLLLTRDYWQATSRPAIREREISPTPLLLSQLTAARWREALDGAAKCLDPAPGRRGRAVQRVTLAASGRTVEGPVSPHLTFTLETERRIPWAEFLADARARLEPLYRWTDSVSAA